MRNILFLILITAIVNVDLAKADYAIGFNATNSMISKNVTVGDAFLVDLYLFETTTTSLTDHGLLGFGARANYNSAVIQTTGANNAAAFPIVGGSPDLSVNGQIDVYGGSTLPPKSSAIHLTTLSFLATSVGNSIISFGDYDSLISDFTLNDMPTFRDLDPSIFPTPGFTYNFMVNVTAVPEPGSLLGSSAIVLTYMMRRRRKRRMLPIFSTDGRLSNHKSIDKMLHQVKDV